MARNDELDEQQRELAAEARLYRGSTASAFDVEVACAEENRQQWELEQAEANAIDDGRG